MKTREEAIAAASADGIAEKDITEAVIKMYGYVAPNPLGGVTPAAPAVGDADVAQQTADLDKEAQGNTTGAQIVDGLAKAGEIAVKVAGVAVP